MDQHDSRFAYHPPQPTTYLDPVQCVRCGTWTPAGESVMTRGVEAECWEAYQ